MAGVVDELKTKLAELDARLQAIRSEQTALERDRQAFETVIACYEPTFRPNEVSVLKRGGSPETATPTKRVTALLKGKNSRHLVLEILRQVSKPIAAAEVAGSFVGNEKLGGEVEGLSSHITSRFATVLNGLQNRVWSVSLFQRTALTAVFGRSLGNQIPISRERRFIDGGIGLDILVLLFLIT